MHRPRRRLVTTVALTATILGVAACGAADTTGSPPPSAPPTTPVLPATTPFVTAAPGVTLGSVVFGEVTEPCSPPSPTGPDGSEAMLAEVSRLEPMIGQVLAYGQAHAEAFGSYGLTWHDGDDASVFVSFTGDLDVHRAALTAAVSYPDELVVCQVAVADADLQTLQEQIAGELEGKYFSLGVGATGLEVGLNSHEEAIAAQLLERFGDAVQVTVGAMRYPPELAVDTCVDLPESVSVAGLDIVPVVDATGEPGTIDTGDTDAAQLQVTLTNTGSAPIQFSSGVTSGVLIDDVGQVVSTNTGGIAAVGIGVDLAPGASAELPLVVGTASCRAALDYTLPPGPYRLVVLVPANGSTIVSEPVAVTLR